MNNALNNPLGLETIKDGRPPKSRLSDAQHALTLVRQMVEGSKKRLRENTMIQGMFDGNAPYSPSKLRSASQSWRANFSTLEGKAHLSSALAPYYDLFASVPVYADVELDAGDGNYNAHASRVAAAEWTRMLRQWKGFHTNLWQMFADFVGFGKGFLMRSDKSDWRYRYVGQNRVLVPDGTTVDADEDAEIIAIRESVKVHTLWGWIKNESAAASVGWNRKTVLRSIANATPEKDTQDYEAMQQQLRDHDLYTSSRSSAVQLAHIFVREFDGKWSHLIIDENLTSNKNESLGFLFERRGRFDKLCEFLAPFFFEVLAGTWNGITGLGDDIFAIMQAKDRIRCSQVDALMMRMGVTLKALNASSMQKLGLVQFGAFNIIPPDFDVQQSTIFGDIESSIAVNRDLDGMVQANTGIYRPRIESGPGNPETATEYQLKLSQATVLSSSAVNRFYIQLDGLYEEMYRRTVDCMSGPGSELAKEFRERCKDKGVPVEALKKVCFVRAYRNIGNGSITQRQQSLLTLGSVVTQLPETGRSAWLDDTIATVADESKVERYNPKDPEHRTPMDQVAWATLENDSLAHGSPVVLTPTQNDVVHTQTHLGAAAMALQSVQQGANPEQVLRFVDGVGAHVALHLQRMAQDPTRKQEHQLFTAQWKQLASTADELKGVLQKQAQEQQQNQQQAQELDAKLALKAVETQAKIAQQQQKTDAALDMKREKHEADMEMKGQSHMQALVVKDASTAADITRKNELAKAAAANKSESKDS